MKTLYRKKAISFCSCQDVGGDPSSVNLFTAALKLAPVFGKLYPTRVWGICSAVGGKENQLPSASDTHPKFEEPILGGKRCIWYASIYSTSSKGGG